MVDSVTSVFRVLNEDIVEDVLVVLCQHYVVSEEVFTSSTVVWGLKRPLRFGTCGIVLTPLGGAVAFAPRLGPVDKSEFHERLAEIVVLPHF